MGRSAATLLYVVFMAVVVIGVDLLFFRNRLRRNVEPPALEPSSTFKVPGTTTAYEVLTGGTQTPLIEL